MAENINLERSNLDLNALYGRDVMLEGIIEYIAGNIYLAGLIGGLIVLILTFLGSLPALLGSRISDKTLDIGLGFSAGIMLVASFTSLLLPAIELGGIIPAVLGFIIGAITIMLIEEYLPHEHFIKGYEGPKEFRDRVKAVWLLVFAIIIHNFPEGLAVGSSIAYAIKDGIVMAIAIGIQDIPEGFAVAIPLVGIKERTSKALLISFLSGLSEFVMVFIPIFLTKYAAILLPYLLGYAGGAMIYVVSHEVIPETHRKGFENYATVGFLIGFITMLVLDSML